MDIVINIVQVQAIGSVVLLIGFLVATTLIQQRKSMQVASVLEDMSAAVKGTTLYASAQLYFKRREVPNLFTSAAHQVPIYFLIVVVAACSWFTYFGAQYFSASDITLVPSYVLGGAYATNPHAADADLLRRQSETVFVGAMAFQAAYVWMIAQLVNRINNDDMNPTTYYYLSIRILTACLVAGIARHVIEAIPAVRDAVSSGKGNFPTGLAALGFVIGWNPSLWIGEMLIMVGNLLKQAIPAQRWPNKTNVPMNMALMMVQGLVPDKIDRLNELDIDNAQKLAHENPIIIYLRTSYTLELIIDWVAQGMLVEFFEDDKVQKLRVDGIRDIFGYHQSISTDAGMAAVQQRLDIPSGVIASHRSAIEDSPVFQRLAELRDALKPGVPPKPALAAQAEAAFRFCRYERVEQGSHDAWGPSREHEQGLVDQ